MSRDQIDDPAWAGSSEPLAHGMTWLLGAIGDAFGSLARLRFTAPWRRDPVPPRNERIIS